MPKPTTKDFYFEIRLDKNWALKQAFWQTIYMALFLFTSIGVIREFANHDVWTKFMIVSGVIIAVKGSLTFPFDPPYKAVALNREGIAFDMRWGKGIMGAEWEFIDIVKYKANFVTLMINGQKITVRKANYNDTKWGRFYAILCRQLPGKITPPERNSKFDHLLKSDVTTVVKKLLENPTKNNGEKENI